MFEVVQSLCMMNIVDSHQATDLKMYQPGHCTL